MRPSHCHGDARREASRQKVVLVYAPETQLAQCALDLAEAALLAVIHRLTVSMFVQDADSDDVDQSFRSHADQIGAKRRRALSV